MNKVCDLNKCCACKACGNICPKGAISFSYNEYGFLMPVIDQEKCINCGLCVKVCHENSFSDFQTPNKCFASIRSDNLKRLDSASGGIGSSLYEAFLSMNDASAYGVLYNDSLKPVYTKICNNDDILKARGSKYVFSDMNTIFKSIEQDLRNNKKTLFIGLPCHVASVKKYLNIKNISVENFYCCDIFCHGVASELYFEQDINYYLKKYRLNSIENITFRSNRKRRNYRFTIYSTKRNGKKKVYSKSVDEDYYFYGFSKEGMTLRESCYSCKYSTDKRVGDLSIGDFIGLGKIEKYGKKPDFSDFNTSCILVNSIKGDFLLNVISNEIKTEKRHIYEAVSGGPSLQEPYKKSPVRDLFLEKYKKTNNFIKAIEYASGHHVLKSRLKRSLLRWAKDIYCLKIKK